MSAILSAGPGAVILTVDNPGRDDFGGLLVWMSTTPGFSPGPTNLVYNYGPDFIYRREGLAPGVTQYVRYALTSLVDLTTYTVSGELSATPTASPPVAAEDIFPGTIRGSNVLAGSVGTKGSTLAAAVAAAATTIPVLNTTDFLASGSAVIFSATPARDFDVITYTGKTATSLTGVSGVLAHSQGEVIIPLAKAMILDSNINEMRFYGDRGDGAIELLAAIGESVWPTSGSKGVAVFGSLNATHDFSVMALSGSGSPLIVERNSTETASGKAALQVVSDTKGISVLSYGAGAIDTPVGSFTQLGAGPVIALTNVAEADAHIRMQPFTTAPSAANMLDGDVFTLANGNLYIFNGTSSIRLARTGDAAFGLGDVLAHPMANLDSSVALASGIYNADPSTAGTNPIGAGVQGVVYHIVTGTTGMQLFLATASGRMFTRNRAASAWDVWKEWADDADILALSSSVAAGYQPLNASLTSIANSNSLPSRFTLDGGYTSSAVDFEYQPAATSKAAAATLTAAELLSRLIRYTGAAATLTLPTAASIDTATGIGTANRSFDFWVINTGTGIATLALGTGITAIGALTVAINGSVGFRMRRTGAAAYIIHRLST